MLRLRTIPAAGRRAAAVGNPAAAGMAAVEGTSAEDWVAGMAAERWVAGNLQAKGRRECIFATSNAILVPGL